MFFTKTEQKSQFLCSDPNREKIASVQTQNRAAAKDKT
jgi:hypothetical protein